MPLTPASSPVALPYGIEPPPPVAKVLIKAGRGLKPISFRELAEYKDLLYFLVLRDVTVVYKQTVLGFGWAILTPFLSMVVFSVVFGRLAKVPTDGIPYPIFSFAALLPWTYFSGALTGSINSLIQGQAIFTKVYFPRIFIPLVPVFSKLVDLGIGLVFLFGLMLWFGMTPGASLIFLPIPLVIAVLTASGAGLWLSSLAVQYRDVKHGAQFLVQILMYAAPVVWPASLIPEAYRGWYAFYPMAGVIEGFRSAILGQQPMPWEMLAKGSLVAVVIFLLGALYYRKTEQGFADVA